MVLSTLALVGIIQLLLLLAGGIFFLFLHTRFLKKQIRELKGEEQSIDSSSTLPMATLTESAGPSFEQLGSGATNNAESFDDGLPDADRVSGEISELRKMLDEELLLTANLRKLIEALEQSPDSASEIAEQQKSSLLHLEEYIKLSREEGAAVEEKIAHYREQLSKAKKLITHFKEQFEHGQRQTETAQSSQERAQEFTGTGEPTTHTTTIPKPD